MSQKQKIFVCSSTQKQEKVSFSSYYIVKTETLTKRKEDWERFSGEKKNIAQTKILARTRRIASAPKVGAM